MKKDVKISIRDYSKDEKLFVEVVLEDTGKGMAIEELA
jgi:hypothetical protein